MLSQIHSSMCLYNRLFYFFSSCKQIFQTLYLYLEQVLKTSQAILLWCATPETLVRQSKLAPDEAKAMAHVYYNQQKHDSLMQYLHYQLVEQKPHTGIFVQVCHLYYIVTYICHAIYIIL